MNDRLTFLIKSRVPSLFYSCLLIILISAVAFSAYGRKASGTYAKRNIYSPDHFKTPIAVCGVEMQDSVVGYTKSSTNNQIFYLLTIKNTGTLRDSFNLTYSSTGTPLYTYLETVSGTLITKTEGIEPGASYSFIIRFVVPFGSPAQTTNFTNLVATSSICGAAATDTTHLLTHLYSGKPATGDSCDVGVTKTADVGVVTAGNRITYSVSLLNNLPGGANDVFVIDTLSSTVVYDSSYISVLPSGGEYSLTYNSTTHVVQFKYLKTLGQNQPITFKIIVKPACTAVPSVKNKVLVSSSTYDNKATNDTSSVITTVTPAFSAPSASGITNCYNSAASLTASGAGSGTGYQWYSASSGGSLLYTGQNYTTPVLNSSITYYVGYYDLDTTTCTGPRTAVTVNVLAAPQITGPSAITVCPNEPASFTVSATGTSPTYQWQESTNGGSNWTNLVNSSVYSGVTSATLTVTPSYSMNGYEYRCQVATNGCTSTLPGTAATLTVRKSYTWLGVNTNWDDSQNWCSGVPDSSSDVTIPSGLTYYPIITGTASTHDIYIAAGTTVTLDSGTIRLFGAVSGTGLIDAQTGTVKMKGSAAQTIAGSNFTNKTVLNLVDGNISSSGLAISSALADTLKISGTLSFGTDSSKLNTGDNINLLSTAKATANVGVVNPGNTITGEVTVDRYINTGTATGEHAKSWQFLSTPTRGQTIRQSWMENGNNAAGYGTRITSPSGSGFDASSILPSMKYYDVSSNSWIGVSGGNDSLYRSSGYMLFIRGDRTVINSFAPANNTILRSRGKLLTGTIGPVTVPPGYFQSSGNPYASIIDFTKASLGTGVDKKFYAWDPYLNGTFGYGGYQTVTEANDWKPVPGGTAPYNAGVANPAIQSGQAFFIYSTGVSSFVAQDNSLYFTEDCKIDGNTAVNFSRKFKVSSPDNKSFLRVSLYLGDGAAAQIADGNAVVFASKYSNKVDRDDAVKITNGGENFCLLRDGKLLAVEARNLPLVTDTLFYYLSNLHHQKYQLRFAPEGMQNVNVQPLLLDTYIDTFTPISLTDTTTVNIVFTSDPASKAPARFKVVFRNKEAVAIPIVSLDVNNTPSGVIVNWKVTNEKEINSYEVQLSSNGKDFATIAWFPTDPLKNGNYSWSGGVPASGNNFYRIRFNGSKGASRITDSILLFVPQSNPGPPQISIAPNPAPKGSLSFYLSNQPAGVYSVKLLNLQGQTVYTGKISFSGNPGLITFTAIPPLAGLYHSVLSLPNGEIKNFNVIY